MSVDMAKMGRPPKPAAERLSELLTIRVTAEELAAIEAAAKASGKKARDWAREKLVRSAKSTHRRSQGG